jgi:hypothetical protein
MIRHRNEMGVFGAKGMFNHPVGFSHSLFFWKRQGCQFRLDELIKVMKA